MKMTTSIIIGIALTISLGIFLGCKPKNKTAENPNSEEAVDPSAQQENSFYALREMVLSVTPEQLGLQTSNDTHVYGIIMDWNIGDGIATVAAYQTGDASLYLSSGGGVIGGGQHENVRQVVLPYVQMGQRYLSKAEKAESTPLPNENSVRFYLLTNQGTYSANEKMENIENETSEWSELFEEANKVLTELSLTTGDN